MPVKPINTTTDKLQEFVGNRVSNRCCAVSRIVMGAAFTCLFSAKTTVFSFITALSRVNRGWYNTWKERTVRSGKMTGCSLALSMQGVRQFLWYSTAQNPNATFKRDVERIGTAFSYEFIGEDNWEKNVFKADGGVIPLKRAFKAVIGIYPKEEY